MLSKLKKLIEQNGLSKVAYDLGYRCPDTIYKWMSSKKVPKIAKAKLIAYIKESEKCTK